MNTIKSSSEFTFPQITSEKMYALNVSVSTSGHGPVVLVCSLSSETIPQQRTVSSALLVNFALSNQDNTSRCFELHVFSDILLPVKGRKVFICTSKRGGKSLHKAVYACRTKRNKLYNHKHLFSGEN